MSGILFVLFMLGLGLLTGMIIKNRDQKRPKN